MAEWKIAKLINERGSQTVVFPGEIQVVGSRVSVGRIGKRILLQPIRLKAPKTKLQAKGVYGRKVR